nr:hypothetical protein [Tanacetum cinerariifolium]
MLRVFPITLTEASRRWKNMLPSGSINTWDLLDNPFIQKCCPLLKTAKKFQDLNNQQKVQIFYRGLDIPSLKVVDSQGLIPMMPPAEALKSIQDMADHLQNWYDRATTYQWSGHNSNDIIVINNRLDSLGCDMRKLKESIHAVQVGCKIYEEVHLTQECPLKEEGKIVEHVKYIGFLKETINKY